MQAVKMAPQPDDGVSQKVEHVKLVPLFQDLLKNEAALSRLADMMEERTYKPGTAIIKEGEAGSEMFLLIEGNASVFKKTGEGEMYKVAILDGAKHVFFGEGSLLDSDARSATITAETVCICLVLSSAQFDQFGLENPQWSLPVLRRIARVVMARLRRANDDMTLLYNALVAEIRGN